MYHLKTRMRQHQFLEAISDHKLTSATDMYY